MYPELKRYELFGWDYEIRNPLSDDEVSWYLKFAERTSGPILELACGTARLLVVIAENGFDIDGIDLSQTMIKTAFKRIHTLPSEVQSRIRLHHKDITDFSLDRTFNLILIADGSFSILATKEQQISCLRHVYNHLRADGIFLISVRRFDPSQFTAEKQILDWSDPVRHPEMNEIVRRRIENQLVENGKKLKSIFLYKTKHRDGSETIEECTSESPVMSKEAYMSLLSEAGFDADVYMDYQEKADDGASTILCFVCRKS